MNIYPTWIIAYWPRRPTLTNPLTGREIERIEVGAPDEERALAAFRQRYPACCKIVSISMGSATGWA